MAFTVSTGQNRSAILRLFLPRQRTAVHEVDIYNQVKKQNKTGNGPVATIQEIWLCANQSGGFSVGTDQ